MRDFKYIQIFILFFAAAISSTVSHKSHDGDWSHEIKTPGNNGVEIRWKNTKEEHPWITMEIKAPTEGYVGVGFSPNGAMTGADIYIGWIDSYAVPQFKDMYAVNNGLPIEDPTQHGELISLTHEDGWTSLMFKRKWATCDDRDITLTNDTVRLIWAHGPVKPNMVNGQFQAHWHGADQRGAKSVIISDVGARINFPDDAPHLYNNVKHWDMKMHNVPVEAINTTYWCKVLKAPPTTRKHHLIGWKPILTPENVNIVHHIVVYECAVPKHESHLFDKHTNDRGGLCYTKNMPMEVGRNCVAFMFVWVVGNEGEMFPEQVGIPLGEDHGGSTYFMVEMHYENPGLRPAVDSSGIRIFYTENLRKFDGGVFLTGYRHSPFLLIPPKQDNFVIHGLCGSECSELTIPPGGIHITNTLVHMHLWGKKIRLRHFRNGVEQPIIAEDNYYDFNYQQSRKLSHEITILPGDELVTECEYDTTKASKYVLGGLATTQEMCEVFFTYYPRINLTQCTSQYEFQDFFSGFGISGVEGDVLKVLKMPFNPQYLPRAEAEIDLPDDARELEGFEDGISYRSVFDLMNVTNPRNLRGKTAGQRIDEINWKNKRIGEELEERWKHGKHYSFCTKPGLKRELLENHIIGYPEITKPLHPNSPICEKQGSSAGTKSPVTGNLHLLPALYCIYKLVLAI